MLKKWRTFCDDPSSCTAKNFAHNKKLCDKLDGGFLHGQKLGVVRKMRYGKHDISYCGCEIIAVYNAMKMLGMPQELNRLICEFELNGLTLIFPSAVFGSSPGKLRRYFDAHCVGYEYYTVKRHFIDNASRSQVGIISFWVNSYSQHPINRFSSGLHTVTYSLDRQSGNVSVYNRYGNDTKPRDYKDIQELINDHRFIAGYIFPNC